MCAQYNLSVLTKENEHYIETNHMWDNINFILSCCNFRQVENTVEAIANYFRASYRTSEEEYYMALRIKVP